MSEKRLIETVTEQDSEILDDPLPEFPLLIDGSIILLDENITKLQTLFQIKLRQSSLIEHEFIQFSRTKGDVARINPDRIKTHEETFNTLKLLVSAIHFKSLKEPLPQQANVPDNIELVIAYLKKFITKNKGKIEYLDHLIRTEQFKLNKTIDFWNKLVGVFQSEIYNKHGEILVSHKTLTDEVLALNEQIKLQQQKYQLTFDSSDTQKNLDIALETISTLEAEKVALETKLKKAISHHTELLDENEKQLQEAKENESELRTELKHLRKQLSEPLSSDTKDSTLVKAQ